MFRSEWLKDAKFKSLIANNRTDWCLKDRKAETESAEFMSNAAIGCLSCGARSERHTRPTAAEYSFGWSPQTVRDYLRSGRIIFYGVRKLLGKRSAGYRMLSEGPKMYNSLRQ